MAKSKKAKPPEIVLSQDELVDIIYDWLKQHAKNVRTGTYNKQDPTHFESFTAIVGMEYGFGKNPDDDEFPPPPENVKVIVEDITWGIEFRLVTEGGDFIGFWSRANFGDGGQWCRCSDGFLDTLKRIFTSGREELELTYYEWEEDDGTMTNANANA